MLMADGLMVAPPNYMLANWRWTLRRVWLTYGEDTARGYLRFLANDAWSQTLDSLDPDRCRDDERMAL